MTHEQIKDDLILFAAGTLDGADLTEMQAHLQTCAECRAGVELLTSDFKNIRKAVAETSAPAGVYDRLLDMIRKDDPRKAVFMPRPRWVLLPWAASLILAVGLVLLARQNRRLEADIVEAKEQIIHAQRERAQAEGILEALRSPEALRVTLSPAKSPASQPRVDAVYSPRSGRLVVIAANLAPLTTDRIYQLWLLPKTGVPIPAGTFRPDAYGHAVYTLASLESGATPTGFAVTVEPKQGSTTPTMPIVLVGKVG